MRIAENPAIITNYENVINWHFGINILILIFIFANYDNFVGSTNAEISFFNQNLATSTNMEAVSLLVSFLDHFSFFLVISGMVLLMFSTLTLFYIRIWIFRLMNQNLLNLVKLGYMARIEAVHEAIIEEEKLFKEIVDLTRFMTYPIIASTLGVFFLFTYILINISILATTVLMMSSLIFYKKLPKN